MFKLDASTLCDEDPWVSPNLAYDTPDLVYKHST